MKLRAFLRTILLSVTLCLCGYPLLAQTPTVVSGTILDPNGLPYSYARVSAQLIPTTASPTILVGGIPVQIGGQQNATTDANGSFSMNLFCNIAGGGCSAISPGGTQWQFTVTITGIALPYGTGPQFFSSIITISGASQSVSATLSAAAPALSRGGGAPTTFAGVPTGSCTGAQTAVDTTAGGHFYKCNGGVWQDVGPTAAGAVAWSSLLAPTVNLALNHAAFTTTFTWGAATGPGVNMFNLTDSTNNTGTGHILNVNLAPGSAAKPAQFAVNGDGVEVSNAGLLSKIGLGGLDYGSLLNFPAACGANLFAKQIAATAGCTQVGFSNLSGTIASAQFGSWSANTFLGAPNGSAGNPTPRLLVGADIPQINLAASGNGGVGGTLPGANMSQVNLAASGNGGVGGTLPRANLPATASNCTGSNFAQGLNAGGTPICVAASVSGIITGQRFVASQGTALVAGDFALSSAWGSTATVTGILGTDQAWQMTVTAQGAGLAAGATVTLTFKDGTWTNSPICVSKLINGTGQLGTIVTEATTATTYTLNYTLTPATGLTYRFSAVCMGR